MSIKLKNSPNYDEIISFLYEDEDIISKQIVNSYQEYLFNVKNIKSKQTIDRVMKDYINKEGFYKYVQNNMMEEDIYDTYDKVIIKINRLYREYEEEKLKIIKNSRWI